MSMSGDSREVYSPHKMRSLVIEEESPTEVRLTVRGAWRYLAGVTVEKADLARALTSMGIVESDEDVD